MSTATKFTKSIVFEKRDAEQSLFGVVYPAGVLDTQKEFTDTVELAKAVEALSQNQNWPELIDENHNGNLTESRIVESYIAKESGPTYSAGDWVALVRVDDNTWPKVANGSYKAFSIGGMSKREQTTFNGEPAKRMFDITVQAVSLVPNGASRAEFVAKNVDGNTMPPWFKSWAEKSNERLEALESRYGLGKSGDAFMAAEIGDFVRDNDGLWLEKVRAQTFIEVNSHLAQRLEKAHKLRNRRDKKRVRRIAEVARPKNKRNASNNRSSVAAKSELERHLDFYSALHSVASTNGEYTAQQRARMMDLAREASQHGGADKVWEGLIDTGPDAYAARNRSNPLKGLA